jgi:uncharacterized protein YjiS (DUF1127 family)
MRDYALHQAEFSSAAGHSGLFTRIWRNWQARRAVASLDRLDDFLLHDIGISRGDIARATAAPLSENAALVLEDISRSNRLMFGRERFGKAAGAPATFSPVRGS